MDYDVSLHDLVKLFVVIPTSPRTSKTEFVCSRYVRFRIDISAAFVLGGVSGVNTPESPVWTSFHDCRQLQKTFRSMPGVSAPVRSLRTCSAESPHQDFLKRCWSWSAAPEVHPEFGRSLRTRAESPDWQCGDSALSEL